MKIFMKVAVFVVSLLCGGATALAQRPTKAELDELVERYKPRLPSVTAEDIESLWLDRLKDEPWYSKLHGEWVARKDDPHILQKLQDEHSCTKTELSNRDTTFQGYAEQYRCTADISEPDYSGHMVFYANLDGSGLLASVVVLAWIPLPFSAPGIGPDEIAAMRELCSDIFVRIDNARAPPGVHVNYGKDLNSLKFAAQFR